ncbi:MAG: hypothetical protein HXM47_05270 [Pseudoleptotrichia goodfellowii]|jgi:hypothetical protein|nr:hypothetical protein [Pseudoleptotrichia goodfellowii]
MKSKKITSKKALLVFSHELTENQIGELIKDFEVKKIEKLPEEIQKIWSNVDSEDETYEENLEKIKEFIEKNNQKGDVLLIQGNWGYTYNLVKWAFEREFTPIYSFTKRDVEEIKEGENIKKISYFKHERFRKYE